MFVASVVGSGCAYTPSPGGASPGIPSSYDARALFCAYGGVGTVPDPLPPGYEADFAVVVIAIESSRSVSGVTVADFALLDAAGAPTRSRRVVELEEFDRPRVTSEGEFAYYLNPNGTRKWDGIVQAGRSRIRIRFALEHAPAATPVGFRLTFGSQVIEGRIAGEWPT